MHLNMVLALCFGGPRDLNWFNSQSEEEGDCDPHEDFTGLTVNPSATLTLRDDGALRDNPLLTSRE